MPVRLPKSFKRLDGQKTHSPTRGIATFHASGPPLAQRRSGRADNDVVRDADHPPQSANGLLSSFAVQGTVDSARKCHMAPLDLDMDGVETNLPAKKTAYAVFQFTIRKTCSRI